MQLCNVHVLLAAAVLLGACGESSDAPPPAREPTKAELEAVWEEAQPIIDDELSKEAARSRVRFPCTLYDKQSASALLGSDLEAPDFASVFNSGNDGSFQAEACSWISWGDGPSMTVWVSRPEHFDGSRVQCIGMSQDDETQMAHGGRASWFFQGTFAWSKLRVCRDDALFEIEIHDGPVDEAEALELVSRIADRVVNSF